MYEAHDFRIDLTDGPGGIRLARPSGEIDLATVPALRDCLTACIEDGTPFVMDLEAVTFLGSAGVQALVDAAEAAARRDVPWALAGSHRSVVRPIEVTGLAEQLPLHPSVTVALCHLGSVSSVG